MEIGVFKITNKGPQTKKGENNKGVKFIILKKMPLLVILISKRVVMHVGKICGKAEGYYGEWSP